MRVKRKAKELRDILKYPLVSFPQQVSSKYLLKDKHLYEDDVFAYIIYEDASYEIAYTKEEILQLKEISIYARDMSVERFMRVKRNFKVHDVSAQIDELREIKDKEEIERMKKAAKIALRSLKELEDTENKSEIEVEKELEIKMLKQEAKKSFDIIVAYNKNTSSVHHIPKNYNPRNKTTVLIDWGAQYREYNTDFTITWSKHKKAWEDVKHTLLTLEDIAKEGATTTQLTKKAAHMLKAYGENAFHTKHLLGHGVGLEVHEKPHFHENATLKSNMVITLEPAVYFKGKYGIRLENTYIIRKEKKAKPLIKELPLLLESFLWL